MNTRESTLFIIDRLGGTTAAAEFCEVTPSAVSQWKCKGRIPKGQIKFLKAVRPDLFEDRRKNYIHTERSRRSTDKKSPRGSN